MRCAVVTFRYRHNRSQQIRLLTLPALEFIGRFLQHVLPQGCAKVRYYGICSSSCGQQLDQARTLLKASLPAPSAQSLSQAPPPQPLDRCPHCRVGQLIQIEVLPPERKLPP